MKRGVKEGGKKRNWCYIKKIDYYLEQRSIELNIWIASSTFYLKPMPFGYKYKLVSASTRNDRKNNESALHKKQIALEI